jgi:hypothetical protein
VGADQQRLDDAGAPGAGGQRLQLGVVDFGARLLGVRNDLVDRQDQGGQGVR